MESKSTRNKPRYLYELSDEKAKIAPHLTYAFKYKYEGGYLEDHHIEQKNDNTENLIRYQF